MDHGPESPDVTKILHWIAYERDAAWTAKLAILRASSREDVRHFGACLREHDRHADELTALARATDRGVELPKEACFVTGDPFVVSAIDNGAALVDAREHLEAVRIDRYISRRPTVTDEPLSMLDGLLDRHLADTRARLDRFRGLRGWRRDQAA